MDTPERTITTVISNLYVYPDKVRKVYKKEKFFFADLSNSVAREEFIREDFFWNNIAAPGIYRKLVEENGDLVIEMTRIDDTHSLTKLALSGALTAKHVEQFIDALVDILDVLTRERRSDLAYLFDKGLQTIMLEDLVSMREWLYDAGPYITKKEADYIVDTLRRATEQEPYFESGILCASIDSNSDNLLLLDGRASFIDIMPPMPIWRVVDEYATVARTVVDVEVLAGKELGNVARAAYSTYGRDVPPIARLVHEIRGACIQWSYRYSLNQPNIATLFGHATKTKSAELQRLLG